MSDEALNEVFRIYGHAAFYAYNFESALAALAGTLHSMTHPYKSRADLDQYDAQLRAKLTAGHLIDKELSALTKECPDWGNFLTEVTDVRNRLIHRFYEEHLPNLKSESGCKLAVRELKVIAIHLKRGSDEVRKLYLSIAREHLGFNDKRFHDLVARTVKRWSEE